MECLLNPFISPYPSAENAKPHPIDLPHASRMYKTLLQGGHFSREMMSISRCPSYSPSEFTTMLVKRIEKETILGMAKGNGAFVVAELVERVKDEGDRDTVKGWFGEKEMEELKGGDGKGRKVLLEKLEGLVT
jgi:pumilio family protein 6